MAKLFNVNPTSPSAGDNIFFFTKIDGTTIDTWDWTQPNTSGALNGAGVFISHTTPSAGAHTITFVGELFRSGSGTYSTTTSLRVSASFS